MVGGRNERNAGGGEGGISQTGKREYTRGKNGRGEMISAEEKPQRGGQIEGWTVEIIDVQKKKRRKKTATPRKRLHTAETSTYYGPHYITCRHVPLDRFLLDARCSRPFFHVYTSRSCCASRLSPVPPVPWDTVDSSLLYSFSHRSLWLPSRHASSPTTPSSPVSSLIGRSKREEGEKIFYQWVCLR